MSTSLSNATLTGTCTVNGLEIGFRNIPQTTKNANYTMAATDSGYALVHNDTSSYTYTINASVFSAGNVVTVINDTSTGNITIAAGVGVNLYLPGSTTPANRTVGVRGVGTIIFTSATTAYVGGPGVS